MGKYSNLRFFNGASHELNFNYDSVTESWDGIIYAPRVSVGLYETVNLFILEEVYKQLGGSEYVLPISENQTSRKIKFEFEDNESYKGDIFLYNTAVDTAGNFTINQATSQIENMQDYSTSTGTYTYVNNNTTEANPNTGNIYKVINQNVSPEAIHCRIALMSEEEKIHIKLLNIYEVGADGKNSHRIATIKIYGETEGEDERLTILLNNLGMSFHEEDFLIFKSSDVNELKVDHLLLNEKRKELLLEGHNIKPFIGTYKAIINAIKFFGYDNIKLKEYWLNIDEQSAGYGKLRAVAVSDPNASGYLIKKNDAIELPNSNLKKTSRFSLVYKLNEPDGGVDEWDIPTVKESFDFTPEEILVKLYGLKRRLQKDYLPLQAKIVDITGEGDFFTQFTQNVWRDQHTIQVQNSGTKVDFTVFPERRLYIEDLRLVSQDLADNTTGFPISGQAAIVTEVENFYETYHNQELNTFTTLSNVPIGCPVVLECNTLTDDWNECAFTWNDVDFAANDYTGIASSLYTWNTLWKKDVYEAEWVIKGPRGYSYNSRGPVETYKKMLLVLPNNGTYDIVLNLYDLYNARSYRRKTDIVVHNKAVELYGFYSFKPEMDQWNLDDTTWDLAGGYFEEPQVSYNTMDDMVASWYLTLDRANYPHDATGGLDFSTVSRYLDTGSATGFAETTGPFVWKNLKAQAWDDGYGITWDSTRIGSDLTSSFRINLFIESGGTFIANPINKMVISCTDPVTNLHQTETYIINSPIPLSSSHLSAFVAIQNELNSLTPDQYPLFSRFKYNAILMDTNNNGTEDTAHYILAVGKEYSSKYDFTFIAMYLNTTYKPLATSGWVHYKAYNPKWNDIILFNDHANISLMQHITMTYDKTNMPGIISQTWVILNNTTNKTVTYQGQWLTYLFSERGDYTIQLTVTDCNGNVNTTKRNMISVVAPLLAKPRRKPKYQYTSA
jgi:hypothetical protein